MLGGIGVFVFVQEVQAEDFELSDFMADASCECCGTILVLPFWLLISRISKANRSEEGE